MTRPRGPRAALPELRAAIRAAGYSHGGFAALLGVRNDYLTHVLAGRKPIPPDLLPKSAQILGVPVEQLRPREGVTV